MKLHPLDRHGHILASTIYSWWDPLRRAHEQYESTVTQPSLESWLALSAEWQLRAFADALATLPRHYTTEAYRIPEWLRDAGDLMGIMGFEFHAEAHPALPITKTGVIHLWARRT